MSQKNLESHNIRGRELETRYEFITYEDNSTQRVIFGSRKEFIMDLGACIAQGLGIKLMMQTNWRQLGEGLQQWLNTEMDWNTKSLKEIEVCMPGVK